ncbi:hypothetical protein ACHQM5_008503 [Ranunculus cassubicifolius]
MSKGIQAIRIMNNQSLNIGISLGSTNSYLSVLEVGTHIPKVINKFRTEVITKQKGCHTSINPKDRILGFNRLLGTKFDDPIVQKEMNYVPYKIVRAPNGVDAWVQTSYGHLCSPTQMLTGFFKKIKDLAELNLGLSVDSKVVVSFPSKFHCDYIKEVVEAAKIARLGSLSFVHEFTAVATSYGCTDKEGVFAIVDLGARSFDVSLFEVVFSRVESSSREYKRGFKLKGIPKRDLFLGGRDFDNVIVEYMMSEIKGIQGTDLAEDGLVLQRLREVAEECKIQLSSSTEYEITLPSITSDASGEGRLMGKPEFC